MRREPAPLVALGVAALMGWFWRAAVVEAPELSGPVNMIALVVIVILARWLDGPDDPADPPAAT
jgi:hypothetical protein